ncbi:MAG: CpXC domain-containing protein [Anaerolineae bacterium]
MPRQTTITCPNCRRPFSAIVETVIDAGQDPQAKARLLTGQVNAVQCPNCGHTPDGSDPLLYHGASKELLISFVPME